MIKNQVGLKATNVGEGITSEKGEGGLRATLRQIRNSGKQGGLYVCFS